MKANFNEKRDTIVVTGALNPSRAIRIAESFLIKATEQDTSGIYHIAESSHEQWVNKSVDGRYEFRVIFNEN